jgi:hypothetical protein
MGHSGGPHGTTWDHHGDHAMVVLSAVTARLRVRVRWPCSHGSHGVSWTEDGPIVGSHGKLGIPGTHSYPLVMTNSLPWYNWRIEIDALPNLKMVDLSMALLNNQMLSWSSVKLIISTCHGFLCSSVSHYQRVFGERNGHDEWLLCLVLGSLPKEFSSLDWMEHL